MNSLRGIISFLFCRHLHPLPKLFFTAHSQQSIVQLLRIHLALFSKIYHQYLSLLHDWDNRNAFWLIYIAGYRLGLGILSYTEIGSRDPSPSLCKVNKFCIVQFSLRFCTRDRLRQCKWAITLINDTTQAFISKTWTLLHTRLDYPKRNTASAAPILLTPRYATPPLCIFVP